MPEPKCYDLAHNILNTSLPGLKVVVIRSHWYWLSREGQENNSQGRVWRWNDATTDLEEADVLRASLTIVDWNYLNSTAVPYWDEKILDRDYYNRESGYMWNTLTALRVQEPNSTPTKDR